MKFNNSEYWSVLRNGGVTVYKDLEPIKEWFGPVRFIKCKRLTNEGNKWILTDCYLSLNEVVHIETCTKSQVNDFMRHVEGYNAKIHAANERQKQEDELRALHLKSLKKQDEGDEWKA